MLHNVEHKNKTVTSSQRFWDQTDATFDVCFIFDQHCQRSSLRSFSLFVPSLAAFTFEFSF